MLRACKRPNFLEPKSYHDLLPVGKSTRSRRHHYTTVTNARTSLRRYVEDNRTRFLPSLLTLTPTHATGWLLQ